MTAVKDIMNVSQAMQATALTTHNLKFAMKKKKSIKEFIDVGATNIMGTSLLKANADFIGGL